MVLSVCRRFIPKLLNKMVALRAVETSLPSTNLVPTCLVITARELHPAIRMAIVTSREAFSRATLRRQGPNPYCRTSVIPNPSELCFPHWASFAELDKVTGLTAGCGPPAVPWCSREPIATGKWSLSFSLRGISSLVLCTTTPDSGEILSRYTAESQLYYRSREDCGLITENPILKFAFSDPNPLECHYNSAPRVTMKGKWHNFVFRRRFDNRSSYSAEYKKAPKEPIDEP